MSIADEFRKSSEDGSSVSIADEFRQSLDPKPNFPQAPKGELSFRQDRPIRQGIQKFLRTSLETGGLIAGETAGFGAGALTPIPGDEFVISSFLGGFGFAAGRDLADFTHDLLGLPPSERSGKKGVEAFKQSAKDVAVGTAITVAGKGVNKLATGGFNFFFGKSAKFTPEKRELVELADANNIKLTPAEISGSTPLSMFESMLDKLLFSSGRFAENHLNTLDRLIAMSESLKRKGADVEVIELLGNRIQNATKIAIRKRDDISKGRLIAIKDRAIKLFGTTEEKSIIGTDVQQALKASSIEASQKVKDKFDAVFTPDVVGLDEEIPDMISSKLARQLTDNDTEGVIRDGDLKKILKRIAKRPDTGIDAIPGLSEEDKTLLKSLPLQQQTEFLQENGIIEEVPTIQVFADRIKIINRIIKEGDLGLKSNVKGFKGLRTVEGGIATKMRSALQEDLKAFSDPRGGELIRRFNEANAENGKFKEIYASKQMLKIINADPGKVLDTIVRTDEIKQWRIFRKAAEPEAVEAIRRSLITKFVGPSEEFDPDFTLRMMKRYDKGILKEVLGTKMIDSIKGLAQKTKTISELSITDPLFSVLVDSSPAKVFGAIVKRGNLRNVHAVDAANIERLEKLEKEGILTESIKERLTARYLEELFTFNRQGKIPPRGIVNNASDFGERTKRFFLDQSQIDDLDGIIKIAKSSRGAELLAGNMSGTAPNLMTFSTFGGVLRHPMKSGAAFVFLPQIAAKLYMSDVGRKLFVEGFAERVGSLRSIKIFTELMGILGADIGIDDSKRPQSANLKPFTPEQNFQPLQ